MASDAELAFAALVERFAHIPGVERGTGFGTAPGLRFDGRIFAMLPHDELVVKLPRERCEAMAAAGAGRAFVVGRRTMREWLVVEGIDPEAWGALTVDALEHVRDG
jgi:hypothetical protein